MHLYLAYWFLSAYGVSGRVRFDTAHHSQQVAAQDAFNLFIGVAAVDEALRNVGITADVFELRRQQIHAVEIGADADVFGPSNLGDVIDVVEQVVDRAAGGICAWLSSDSIPRSKAILSPSYFFLSSRSKSISSMRNLGCRWHNVTGEEVDHHDAVLFFQPLEYIIRHVARMSADGERRRM